MAREKEKDDLANPFEKGVRSVPAEPEEGAGVEVKLSDPEDDDDDDDDASPSVAEPTRERGAAAAPERATARERRRDRYKELKQELERERTARTALEVRLAAPPPPPQQQGPGLDEQYSGAMDQIYSAKRDLAQQYAVAKSKGALDGPEGEKLEKLLWQQHQQLDTRAAEINQQYAHYRNPANNPQHQKQQAVANWLQMEHGDVLSHPMGKAVLQYTVAEEARLVNGGAPPNMETARRAIETAKVHFGLSKRPAPTATQRARYDGASSSAGVGGGAGGHAPSTIVLTPAQQQMAEARFPNVSKTEAFKRWANGPGRRMLENRAAARSR